MVIPVPLIGASGGCAWARGWKAADPETRLKAAGVALPLFENREGHNAPMRPEHAGVRQAHTAPSRDHNGGCEIFRGYCR